MSAPSGPAHLDPWDPAVSVDPYPHYPRLRDQPGLSLLEDRECWLISRYDDVRAALRAPGTFSSARHDGWTVTGPRPRGDAGQSTDGATLINSDAPEHTRLRRLVTREFTPSAVAAWEPRVRQIAADLFEAMAEKNESGDADLMRDFAMPLPVMVIAELLGVPTEDREHFKRWTEESLGFASLMPGMQEKAQQARRDMVAYFEAMVAEKTIAPGGDLISLFIRAGQRDDAPLSHREIIDHCLLFLVGGNETTTNVIGNTMCAFDAAPDQARLVLGDATLVPPAVEETLRYDGSSIAMFRTLTEEADVAGTLLPRGSHVMLLYGSANHDERHWGADAEHYRVVRNPTDHLAFGGGPHLCVGAPLARLEARVAIETLLGNTDGLTITDEPIVNQHVLVRGRWSVPISFERRRVPRWS